MCQAFLWSGVYCQVTSKFGSGLAQYFIQVRIIQVDKYFYAMFFINIWCIIFKQADSLFKIVAFILPIGSGMGKKMYSCSNQVLMCMVSLGSNFVLKLTSTWMKEIE